ncbi:BICD family-like cargo adapter 2 [Arapaima gigas]
MISSRKDKLPSPSLEDSFFPFSSSSQRRSSLILSESIHGLRPIAKSHAKLDADNSGSSEAGNNSLFLESDLILAAELGQALLEKNEELGAQLEQRDREIEALQQEKHVLQRQLKEQELEATQRDAALQEQLERQLSHGRDRRQEESEQLMQLSSHNQRLVEQLAEAVSVEHSLRSELRSLQEEMENGSLSRSISSARLESLQAESKVLQERKANVEERLKLMQEDNNRLRAERDGLREKVTELQATLSDREAELDQERSSAFQLRTLYHSLQQRMQVLGEEASLVETTCFPLSLQSEIQQSQAKEAIVAHSQILQEKEGEIQKLKEELQSREGELQALKTELQPFRQSPGKPNYSALEAELVTARQERDSLNQQLLNTIKHKVMLSQEVDAWQEDMRLVIRHQVQLQEEERQRQQRAISRTSRSRSLRLRGEGEKKSFFSSFFSSD